jgi:hypothetical protein
MWSFGCSGKFFLLQISSWICFTCGADSPAHVGGKRRCAHAPPCNRRHVLLAAWCQIPNLFFGYHLFNLWMHLESQSEDYIFNYKKKNHMHRSNFMKSTHEAGPNKLGQTKKIEVPY